VSRIAELIDNLQGDQEMLLKRWHPSAPGERLTLFFLGARRKTMSNHYQSAKSRIVKELIQRTRWRKHKVVDDVLALEGFILNGVHGFCAGMLFRQLTSKNEDRYLRLVEELAPEQLETIRLKKELEAAHEARREAEEAKYVAALKESWKRAGGRG